MRINEPNPYEAPATGAAAPEARSRTFAGAARRGLLIGLGLSAFLVGPAVAVVSVAVSISLRDAYNPELRCEQRVGPGDPGWRESTCGAGDYVMTCLVGAAIGGATGILVEFVRRCLNGSRERAEQMTVDRP